MRQGTWKSSVSAASRLLACALAFAAVLLAGSEASGKKRVVVLGFDGPKSGSAESAVVSIVEKKHQSVSASAYARAQKRLKLRKPTDKNVSKITADIGADAVVIGAVKRKGTRWTLKLSVREGKTGKTIDSVTIRLSGPKIDKDARSDISARLLPILARARGHGSEEVAAKPKKKPKKVAKVVEPEDEDGDEPAPEEPEDDDESPLGAGGGGETEVASSDPAPDSDVSASAGASDGDPTRARRARDAADLSVGVSFMARRMSYEENLPDDLSPNGYRGAAVPGAYVDAEIYPLAFPARRGVLSGLGVAFSFDRTLFLKSRLDGQEFDTSQMRWGIGGRFRFALLLEGAYLVVLSTGEIQDMDNFGAGPANGVVADAALQILVTDRVAMKVGGRYQRMAFDFDGSGADASMRDGDPEQDVGGALDQYFGGYVTIGYLF